MWNRRSPRLDEPSVRSCSKIMEATFETSKGMHGKGRTFLVVEQCGPENFELSTRAQSKD